MPEIDVAITRAVAHIESDVAFLAPGVYEGTWTGYTISVEINGVPYQLTTSKGCPAFARLCKVTIPQGNGNIKVEVN